MNYRKSIKGLVFRLVALMLVVSAVSCAPKPAAEEPAGEKPDAEEPAAEEPALKNQWPKRPASRF